MNLESTFGFDEDLACEGAWIDLEDARIKVAALPNPNYDRHMQPVYRRYRDMGKSVPESEHEIAFAKFVLLDWENVEDEGAELEPTEENKLAAIRKYSAFKVLVRNEAMNRANFKRRRAEAERKN